MHLENRYLINMEPRSDLVRILHLCTYSHGGWIVACHGGHPCVVGCLAASLVSTHLMPGAQHPSRDNYNCPHSLSRVSITEFGFFVPGPLQSIPGTHLRGGEEEAAFSTHN